MYRIQNKQGITMMEMIVVLLVISTLSLMILPFVYRNRLDMEHTLFIEQLARKLNLAQQYAIVSGEDSSVQLDKQVLTNVPSDVPLLFPEGLATEKETIRFYGFTGIVQTYRMLVFSSAYYRYTIHLQFGRGVFWVEKTAII